MILQNLALLAISGTVLLGCIESEKSCYERLEKDFQSSQDFADSDNCSKDTGEQELACVRYALTILRSKHEIYVIYKDNDRNACDFISAGPYLKRN